MNKPKGKIKVFGVYYLNKPSFIRQLVQAWNASKEWAVEQSWVALGEGEPELELQAYTLKTGQFWKFAVANEVIQKDSPFDYLFICDDDVVLPHGFLDRYMEIVLERGFDLSQPARSHDSFIDHPFTERIDGIQARLTRYVEIGPVVCFSRRAWELVSPFPPFPPSGWGFDFVWPLAMEKAGYKMGIVDSLPCVHNLRVPVLNYAQSNPWKDMEYFLSVTPHLKKEEAFRILEVYA
ncbi:DUF707 domain-containing protein [Candidatus Methylacidiphilum infernorum]|nr:DUF707 domain-containing protein [Candidatus Methylacidiphilum infernorum]